MFNKTKRYGSVNKRSGAKHFRHDVGKTHPMNMKMVPHRGGWRL